jgi:hypothetical protein
MAARDELARLPQAFAPLIAELDETAWRARPAPDRWSPLEIICHLRDEEVEDFGARLRVIVEGGTAFAPIDPEGWVHARRYNDEDPRQALAALEARRRQTLTLLGHIDPEKLDRALASGPVKMSGLDILAAWVAHDLLHLRQLSGTLARLWSIRWGALRSDYAGPLPYPPGESRG